jgi:mannose-6-phosphate isomerase-like protein (cupin superfamily)
MDVTRQTFRGYSGYVVGPHSSPHELVALRHTAAVAPWADGDLHLHDRSEEYYLLLAGRLWLLLGGSVVSLEPGEMLMVRPQVSHAVVRGQGRIEHFGIRVPALADRRSLGPIPGSLPAEDCKGERELCQDWGWRASVGEARNQNCWLVGLGAARFHSPHLALAVLDFPTPEAANAGIGTRHRLHLHRRSWEYYVALEGAMRLLVEEELVQVEAGEVVGIPPRVRHVLYDRRAPYRGFTFRVPILDDKVEF